MKFFSRICAVFLCLVMLAAMLPAQIFAEGEAPAADGRPKFNVLSVDEMVAEMGTGWNLGNTFDGHTGFTPSETLWQTVYTTPELLDAVHASGFNTVRIPVTWGTMINDDDYSIDEKWMSRIQDVADYCISNGMYVIINIHHDGAEQSGWLRVATDDRDALYEKFAGVWNTIAERFKDYDEHLLFSAMNEVWGDDGSADGVKRDFEVINALNQLFVDTVRATGSNNAQRWLICPGRYTNIDTTTDASNGFRLPTDTVENRLFVEIHYYDYSFGLSETMTTTEWNDNNSVSLSKSIDKLVDAFTSKGIPVIMGEYGAVNKNNPSARAKHMEVVNLLCRKAGVVPIYWDNGSYDRSKTPADYCFTLIDRETLELVDPEVTYAIMRGYYADEKLSCDSVAADPDVINAQGIICDDTVYASAGTHVKLDARIANGDSNDVLLWNTSDRNVATVLNGGYVHAKMPGTAVITVASQSGSVSKEIKVVVLPAEGSATISTADEITLEMNSCAQLEYQFTSDAPDDYVVFASSNEQIAAVSSVGKLTAKNQGVTYIVLTSASGASAVTKLTVTPPAAEPNDSIELAINVYYNDSEANYFSNEYSENTVVVKGDGQYTLNFDCAVDLSAAARNAGITGLNNLTAVYLKDLDVVTGAESKSYLDNCNIMWDSVTVDGVPLTVTQTEPKSALKASGQFDTNDPINSWDGSYVEEVTVEDHVLNLVGFDNPQAISVTFTISDISFSEKTVAPAKPITTGSISAAADLLSFDTAGETSVLAASADNPKAPVAFYSSDASVAAVSVCGTVNSDGAYEAVVTAAGKGECVITAITPDGKTAEISVNCKADRDVGAKETFKVTPVMIIVAAEVLAVAAIAAIIVVLLKKRGRK